MSLKKALNTAAQAAWRKFTALYAQKPAFKALEERLERVQTMQDIGEHIIEASQLYHDARQATDRYMGKRLAFHGLCVGLPVLAGVAIAGSLMGAALPAIALVGLGASFILTMAGSVATEWIDQNLPTSWHAEHVAGQLVKKAPENPDILALAQSPYFDTVMARFPAMKSSFDLAAKRLQTIAPAAAAAAVSAAVAKATEEAVVAQNDISVRRKPLSIAAKGAA